ncbi:MAG: flagellar hook-length control protein FliK [Anaerohalosphaera sp.]|nr:flagellar hook-length control protein FliK [Anaerohalosphaera sp.]
MMFAANSGLVNVSVTPEQTESETGGETVSFFDLLAGKLAANGKKTNDTASIIPVAIAQLLVDPAITDEISPETGNSIACDGTIDTELAAVEPSLKQQNTLVPPVVTSVPIPTQTEQTSLFPTAALSVPEPLTKDSLTMVIQPVNRELNGSDIADQFKNNSDGPVINEKFMANPPQLSDKIIDDATQSTDIAADAKVKQALVSNTNQGTNQSIDLSDKSGQAEVQTAIEASADTAKEPYAQFSNNFQSAIRQDNQIGTAANSTVAALEDFNKLNVKADQSTQVIEEGPTAGIFTEDSFAGFGQLVENINPNQSASLKQVEMPASAVAFKQITDSICSSVITDDKQITIRLNPQELGEIRISFKSEQDQVTGVIEVSRPELKQMIQSMLPGLLNDIQNSGVNVKKMTVSDDLFQQQFAGDSHQPSDRQGEQTEHDSYASQYTATVSGQEVMSLQYLSNALGTNQVYSENGINVLI